MAAPYQPFPTTGADVAAGDPTICFLATARQVETPPVPPSSTATMDVSSHWYLGFLVHPNPVAWEEPAVGTVGKQVSWQ